MKFLQIIFLLPVFFAFPACEDLSFTDEDLQASNTTKKAPVIDNIVSTEREQIPEETTVLSGNLELSENTIIQNKKVIFDMVTIQTFQYDLTIMVEEFISNHSFIRNFPEGQTAKEREEGRNGGHVLIKAKTVKGSLSLILNGENGGYVPKRKISRRERNELSGRNGENGYDAVYDEWCRDTYIPILGIVLDRDCWFECRVHPTEGSKGENGRRGYPGYIGKRGGDSGSFYLQTLDLSDFYLADVQKTVGLGGEGGKGSLGGFGGKAGENGKDTKDLCSSNIPYPRNGRSGYRGEQGRSGENGKEGTVCLEILFENQEAVIKENNNQGQEELKPNQKESEQTQIETICDEYKEDIMCHEVIVQNQEFKVLEDNQQKGGEIICY